MGSPHVTLPVLLVLLAVLVVNLVVALVRVVAGPTSRDRITGVLFAGTTGSAVLATASVTTGVAALRDVALAVVALSGVLVMARIGAERSVGDADLGSDPADPADPEDRREQGEGDEPDDGDVPVHPHDRSDRRGGPS